MKIADFIVFLLAGIALTCPLSAQDEDADGEEVLSRARGGANVKTTITGGRVVGVGENLGRDKKATVLNYVLYGGRTYQANGRPTLVLHKIERTSPKSGLFSTESTVRNSFIISYQYVEPSVIYLQGAWMKIIEFDNTHLRFEVLTDRKPISGPE